MPFRIAGILVSPGRQRTCNWNGPEVDLFGAVGVCHAPGHLAQIPDDGVPTTSTRRTCGIDCIRSMKGFQCGLVGMAPLDIVGRLLHHVPVYRLSFDLSEGAQAARPRRDFLSIPVAFGRDSPGQAWFAIRHRPAIRTAIQCPWILELAPEYERPPSGCVFLA